MPTPEPIPDYESIRGLARSALASFSRWATGPTADADRALVRGQLERLGRFYRSRRFAEAGRRLASRDPLAAWAGGVFLSFRDRAAMIDYMRFQECADPQPGGGDPLGGVAAAIRETLVPLGRRARVAFRLGVPLFGTRGIRLELRLDPFVNYRAIYARLLRRARAGRRAGWRDHARDAFDRAAGGLKVRFFRAAAVLFARGWGRVNTVTNVRDTLSAIFPVAARLGDKRIAEIEATLTAYLRDRLGSLMRSLPRDTVEDGGIGKLIKLIVGTLIGRANAMPATDPAGATRYIIESARIAYCWAVTYPLVDDVLDSGATGPATRAALRELFAGLGAGAPGGPLAESELGRRMRELCELLAPPVRVRAAAAIRNVFLAHDADSSSRLGDARGDADPLEVALLKSLLVRIATMEICGIPATAADYRAMAAVALFNQLGDDIWDAAEDLRNDRLTPVTRYHRGGGANPYRAYLDFAAFLAGESGAAARPASLAVCHTFKLAHDAKCAETRAELLAALRQFAPAAAAVTILTCTPHVDPDSMLFDFERAARPLFAGSRRPAAPTSPPPAPSGT